MKKIYNLFLVPKIQQQLFLSCCLITLTIAGIMGASSDLTAKAEDSPTVKDDELINYAKSILLMEGPRQEAFGKIKLLISSQEIPQIVCNVSESINRLPRQAKNIAVNYCTRSQNIVQENHLTVDRFNRITQAVQSNGTLKQRIYNILLNLQKNAPSQ
jgi:hypothetical protein